MKYKKCKVCNNELIKVNTKFNLVKCNSCSLVFCETKFLYSEFVTVYNKLYNDLINSPQYATHSIKEYNNLLKGNVKIGLNRKRIIDRNIDKTGRVLEIGSGIGLIGMYLKKYKDIDYLGIEIDETTHLKALKLGVESLNGDFSLMKNLMPGFQTIMLWEVLEHLQDLKLFLELATKNIKVGGNLIFSVPNYNKKFNFKGNNDELYQSAPPIHLNYFTKKSVKKILAMYNFEIDFLRVKRFPYLDFKNKKFYSQVFKSLFGLYHGPTIYVNAKFKG